MAMFITNALFSESCSRLLQWLYGQPYRRFHLSELKRLTRLGSASLQRELNRLTDAGLLNTERVGNLRCFMANPSSPVFVELKSLVTKTLCIEPVLRNALDPLRPQIQAALINRPVSQPIDAKQYDICVTLICTGLSSGTIMKALMPAEKTLGRKIYLTRYTPSEFEQQRAKADSLINQILAQPIMSLIGNINEFSRNQQQEHYRSNCGNATED